MCGWISCFEIARFYVSTPAREKAGVRLLKREGSKQYYLFWKKVQ